MFFSNSYSTNGVISSTTQYYVLPLTCFVFRHFLDLIPNFPFNLSILVRNMFFILFHFCSVHPYKHLYLLDTYKQQYKSTLQPITEHQHC